MAATQDARASAGKEAAGIRGESGLVSRASGRCVGTARQARDVCIDSCDSMSVLRGKELEAAGQAAERECWARWLPQPRLGGREKHNRRPGLERCKHG